VNPPHNPSGQLRGGPTSGVWLRVVVGDGAAAEACVVVVGGHQKTTRLVRQPTITLWIQVAGTTQTLTKKTPNKKTQPTGWGAQSPNDRRNTGVGWGGGFVWVWTGKPPKQTRTPTPHTRGRSPAPEHRQAPKTQKSHHERHGARASGGARGPTQDSSQAPGQADRPTPGRQR